MRQSIVLLLSLLVTVGLGTVQAQRQSVYIGANAGMNLSKFKYTEDLSELYTTTNSLLGLNGGVDVGIELNNFTISTGLHFVQKGSEYQTDNFTDEIGTGFFSAKEELNYLSIPILVGYRKYTGNQIGFTFAMGPSINLGLSGNIDEETQYFGTDDVLIENYKVSYGTGVNDDYRPTQIGFQISPGLIFPVNDKSKITFNVTWDFGLHDSFNERYKSANDFFANNTGNQVNRTTSFRIGYEYHFSFGDKY